MAPGAGAATRRRATSSVRNKCATQLKRAEELISLGRNCRSVLSQELAVSQWRATFYYLLGSLPILGHLCLPKTRWWRGRNSCRRSKYLTDGTRTFFFSEATSPQAANKLPTD